MIKFEHGGDIFEREIVYDFSANLNPLGMPESVSAAYSIMLTSFLFDAYSLRYTAAHTPSGSTIIMVANTT